MLVLFFKFCLVLVSIDMVFWYVGKNFLFVDDRCSECVVWINNLVLRVCFMCLIVVFVVVVCIFKCVVVVVMFLNLEIFIIIFKLLSNMVFKNYLIMFFLLCCLFKFN